jgi:hypothetical protein
MNVRRLLAAGACLLAVAGCDVLAPGAAEAIPGRYRMVSYDGRPLPALVRGQAAGDRVEIVSAELEMRRNFRWVLTSQVDSVAGGIRVAAVRADSGRFNFPVRDLSVLAFVGMDGSVHSGSTAGDTVYVLWGKTRRDAFVR